MSQFTAPTVTNGMSVDELADIVAKLIKQIDWLINGNIDSGNTREIGGWVVGNDSLVSKTGDVGLSSAVTGGDDVRVFVGGVNPNTAATRIYESGKISTNNIQITGGSIDFAAVPPPTTAQVGALPYNDPKISQFNSVGDYLGALNQSQVNGLISKVSQLSSIGDYIGAMSTGQVSGLSSRLTNITSTGVYTGTVGTDKLVAGSALIGDALIGNISASKINVGTLNGMTINGATLSSRSGGTSGAGVTIGAGFGDINFYNGFNQNIFRIEDMQLGQVKLWSPVGSTIYATGSWDFGGATTTGFTAKFG